VLGGKRSRSWWIVLGGKRSRCLVLGGNRSRSWWWLLDSSNRSRSRSRRWLLDSNSNRSRSRWWRVLVAVVGELKLLLDLAMVLGGRDGGGEHGAVGDDDGVVGAAVLELGVGDLDGDVLPRHGGLARGVLDLDRGRRHEGAVEAVEDVEVPLRQHDRLHGDGHRVGRRVDEDRLLLLLVGLRHLLLVGGKGRAGGPEVEAVPVALLALLGGVEGGVGLEEWRGWRRRRREDGEEEDPEPGRGSAAGGAGARSGGAAAEEVEAVVLDDEVVEVLVVGDGDERVEVLAGELVLDADFGLGPRERGEAGREVGEARQRALDGEDLGVAVDVGELVVVGPRLDAAPVADHEPHLGRRRRRK
jgi:hypothetical protein